MKRLLLIQPSKYLEVEGGFYGLAALATYLENDCQVKVQSNDTPLAETIATYKPDIIGITATTLSYPRAIEIMKTAKLLSPKALRIIGGVHISCLPESLDPIFDSAIIGDGEETLLEIVREGNRDNLKEIPGTAHLEGEGVKMNYRKPIDLGKLPIPKLHVYAPQSYRNKIVGFITSRGCPFRCVFCYSKAIRDKVSYYPIEWVLDHFEYATKVLGARFLILWDDNLCADLDRLATLSDKLESRCITEFELSANLRSSMVSEELFQFLKKLHIKNCFSGFESGSDRILKIVKGQDASVNKHKETMRLANKYGISLTVNFMLGMPGEKIEDMNKTIDFIDYMYEEKRAGRYKGRVSVNMAIPFPGTYWWKIAEERGAVNKRMDWKLLKNTPEATLLLDPDVPFEAWKELCKKVRSKVEEAGDIVIWK